MEKDNLLYLPLIFYSFLVFFSVFFLMVQFFCYYFLSVKKASFSHSSRTGVLETKSLSFPLITSLFPLDFLRIISCNTEFTDASFLSALEKCAIFSGHQVFRKETHCFFISNVSFLFDIFESLSLVFIILIIMCLGVDLFGFIPLKVCLPIEFVAIYHLLNLGIFSQYLLRILLKCMSFLSFFCTMMIWILELLW